MSAESSGSVPVKYWLVHDWNNNFNNKEAQNSLESSLDQHQPTPRVATPAAPDQAGPGQASLPVDDGRDALPGPEARNTFQFFVSDPGRHYELLWIATTQPNRDSGEEGEGSRRRDSSEPG